MARIKYSDEIQPLLNEHFGFTFQGNHYGKSMFPAGRNGRFRRPRQNQRQHNNQKAVLQWQNMTPETQAAWNLFAATYQQPSKRNPALFLTGYQLFIKRNSYCFLNHGIDSDFMYLPEMELKTYEETFFTLEAGDNTIDLTELYINNFGILPTPGQWLLFCAIPFSDKSGQFFTPIFDTLEVMAVYVDGLFLNLTLPAESVDILYSVYLSKPVSAGQQYAGTKIRYMGCFTSKKFTSLTDVPAVTPADAGKVWGVNPDGSLGWIEGGGGGSGLTCEDLPECPAIIDIYDSIDELVDLIVSSLDTSIPPIHFGLLYNTHAVKDVRGLFQSGWSILSIASARILADYLGASGNYTTNNVGAKMKVKDLNYWQTLTGLETNSAKTNEKGSGFRDGTTGLFNSLRVNWRAILSDVNFQGLPRFLSITYSDNTFQIYSTSTILKTLGASVFISSPAIGIADGTTGIYTCNNGRIIRTVAINSNWYLADPFVETIFNNGDPIPNVTLAADWIAQNTAAYCAYNNDNNLI